MAKTTTTGTPSLIKITAPDGDPAHAEVVDHTGASLGVVKAYRYETNAAGGITSLEIVIAPGEIKPETPTTEPPAAPEG